MVFGAHPPICAPVVSSVTTDFIFFSSQALWAVLLTALWIAVYYALFDFNEKNIYILERTTQLIYLTETQMQMIIYLNIHCTLCFINTKKFVEWSWWCIVLFSLINQSFHRSVSMYLDSSQCVLKSQVSSFYIFVPYFLPWGLDIPVCPDHLERGPHYYFPPYCLCLCGYFVCSCYFWDKFSWMSDIIECTRYR